MNRSNDLHIEPVRTRRQQHDFYRVKRELYRNDPAAVIPLRRMEWNFLDPARHPFYQHAAREVFVAYRGRRAIGRVAAIIDHLHNQHYADRLGCFGFFESPEDPEVARCLLDAARDWLRTQGCENFRGPLNPSMKGEFGVLVDGHQHSPRLLMAHTPPYYDALLQGQGLAVIKRFLAYSYAPPLDPDWNERYGQLIAVSEKIQSRFPDLRIEPANSRNVEQRLIEVNTIGNRIRSVGWGFVPLTDDELNYMVGQLKRVIRPDMVVTAYYRDRLVGYLVTVPDVNWAIHRSRGSADWIRWLQLPWWLTRIRQCRLIAVGVDPEFRKKGIVTLMTKRMFDRHVDFDHWEFGWIDEDNLASISALGAAVPLTPYRTYHLYQQSL